MATEESRQHNQTMLDLLAGLLADSLRYLRELWEKDKDGVKYLNENMILEQIIPLKNPQSLQEGRLSLEAFYKRPLEQFKKYEIIPCADGYCTKENAYTTTHQSIPKFFPNEIIQGGIFTNHQKSRWVFPSIQIEPRQTSTTAEAIEYIKSFTDNEHIFDPEKIVKCIDNKNSFVSLQNIERLKDLYKWMHSLGNKVFYKNSRSLKLFLDQKESLAAAEELLLPFENNSEQICDDIRIIHPVLHKINDFNMSELEGYLEIHEANINTILVNYSRGQWDNRTSDEKRKNLLGIAKKADPDEQKRIITNCNFKLQNQNGELCSLNELYWESDELRTLFKNEAPGRFVRNDYDDFRDILTTLGISDIIHLHFKDMEDKNVWDFVVGEDETLQRAFHTKFKHVPFIPGLQAILYSFGNGRLIDSDEKRKASILIFKTLLNCAKSIRNNNNDANICSEFYATYIYKNRGQRNWREQYFNNPRLLQELRSTAWIANNTNGYVHPSHNVRTDELHPEIVNLTRQDKDAAKDVCILLNIKLVEVNESQWYMDELMQFGIDIRDESIRQKLIAWKKQLELEQTQYENNNPQEQCADDGNKNASASDEKDIERVNKRNKDRVDETTSKTKEYRKKERKPEYDNNEECDNDPMMPQPVSYEKKAKQIEDEYKKKQARLDKVLDLQNQALGTEKYTYAWLKAMIALEADENTSEDNIQKEAVITFKKIVQDKQDHTMFILSYPSSGIPQWFEGELNQLITLQISKEKKISASVDSMSVDGFTLKIRIKIHDGMQNINYSQISESVISVTKPTFLLDSLQESFKKLNLDDNYNLKNNLPEQNKIQFVFGPPGTGKTTYLAEKVIIPYAENEDEHPHILILTPTNKAADVLLKRVMEKESRNRYSIWLRRFGMSMDSTLPYDDAVLCDKDIKLNPQKSIAVITTIHRYTYDSFQSSDGTNRKISEVPWDYIIIDEASMIPLMWILYPIYNAKNVKKIIIAGDPMQIEPVVTNELSKGENIYTMVNLNDFVNPITEPYQYDVIRLNKQYRSIPAIGKIFSKFAYGGKLEHHRDELESKEIFLEKNMLTINPLTENLQHSCNFEKNVLTIKPLTLLRFPVSPFENIFRIQRVEYSSYHIYSALFTFEFISELAKKMEKNNAIADPFRIGIISPYRVQAEIIQELIERHIDSKKVKICVGTVHGFQGDECEMIFALLNPPRGMGKGYSFINNRKVLNVAISRAKDFLFVAMPNQNANNLQFLTGPLEIEQLMKENARYNIEYQMPYIEEIIWGDRNYINNNTYPTGHQSVNVYKRSERRFELRTSADAVDVQFRDDIFEEQDSNI